MRKRERNLREVNGGISSKEGLGLSKVHMSGHPMPPCVHHLFKTILHIHALVHMLPYLKIASPVFKHTKNPAFN